MNTNLVQNVYLYTAILYKHCNCFILHLATNVHFITKTPNTAEIWNKENIMGEKDPTVSWNKVDKVGQLRLLQQSHVQIPEFKHTFS